MKYTKNYQLNQWDAADRVLREDFNTDNRKVDTALAAVQAACPWSKLAEITTDTETTQIDMDLSAYDLTRYQQLNLYLSCGDGSNATQLQLRCNGLTEGYAIHHDNGNDPYTCDYLCLVDYMNKSDAPGYSKICLYPGRVIMGTWEGAAFPSVKRFRATHHYSCGVLSLAAQDLHTLNLAVYKRDETMAPGTSVLVYGIHR